MFGLVPSHRLKTEDIKIWRQQALADTLYSKRREAELKRLTAEAKDKVLAFLENGPAYVSVSWGKDSVVVADLCRDFGLPTVWVKVDVRSNPDCPAVATAFSPQNYLEVRSPPGGDGSTSSLGIKKAVKIVGTNRRITGLRKSESKQRLLRGSQSTATSCVPIADWTTQQVFAYLQWRRLPIHPAYAMSNGGQFSREFLRVGAIGGTRGSQTTGRREWESIYYKDVLCKLFTYQN